MAARPGQGNPSMTDGVEEAFCNYVFNFDNKCDWNLVREGQIPWGRPDMQRKVQLVVRTWENLRVPFNAFATVRRVSAQDASYLKRLFVIQSMGNQMHESTRCSKALPPGISTKAWATCEFKRHSARYCFPTLGAGDTRPLDIVALTLRVMAAAYQDLLWSLLVKHYKKARMLQFIRRAHNRLGDVLDEAQQVTFIALRHPRTWVRDVWNRVRRSEHLFNPTTIIASRSVMWDVQKTSGHGDFEFMRLDATGETVMQRVAATLGEISDNMRVLELPDPKSEAGDTVPALRRAKLVPSFIRMGGKKNWRAEWFPYGESNRVALTLPAVASKCIGFTDKGIPKPELVTIIQATIQAQRADERILPFDQSFADALLPEIARADVIPREQHAPVAEFTERIISNDAAVAGREYGGAARGTVPAAQVNYDTAATTAGGQSLRYRNLFEAYPHAYARVRKAAYSAANGNPTQAETGLKNLSDAPITAQLEATLAATYGVTGLDYLVLMQGTILGTDAILASAKPTISIQDVKVTPERGECDEEFIDVSLFACVEGVPLTEGVFPWIAPLSVIRPNNACVFRTTQEIIRFASGDNVKRNGVSPALVILPTIPIACEETEVLFALGPLSAHNSGFPASGFSTAARVQFEETFRGTAGLEQYRALMGYDRFTGDDNPRPFATCFPIGSYYAGEFNGSGAPSEHRGKDAIGLTNESFSRALKGSRSGLGFFKNRGEVALARGP